MQNLMDFDHKQTAHFLDLQVIASADRDQQSHPKRDRAVALVRPAACNNGFELVDHECRGDTGPDELGRVHRSL